MQQDKQGNFYQTGVGVSPKEADVIIVPINSEGTIGELNEYVLDQVGYNHSILKSLSLTNGFDLFNKNDIPIIFVVTVGKGKTEHNLKNNLTKAIDFHKTLLIGKKIWIPLMGTGYGNLSYKESYEITISILNGLKNFSGLFIISIPNNKQGLYFLSQIEQPNFNSSPSEPELNNLDIEKIVTEIKDSESTIDKVIKSLNANYYFVGINWNGEKQTDRFYIENIWETGYDDRYSGVIKNILINDILIIKEPHEKDESHIKIIAIGKVVYNPMDGIKVEVDWLVKNLSFDIVTYGYNKSTITTAHLDSVKEIFSKINKSELDKIRNIQSARRKEIIKEILDDLEDIDEPKPQIFKTIPGILSDSESGEDHLDIKKDVEAFARVIAAKNFEPPLAIALLGKWGSGKSFFMRKLKENIQKISINNPQNAFCEGIAHVHFNAWSYMDANLWASLVTGIFEGLNEYIKNDTKANLYKKEIEKKLTQNLNIAKEEIAILQRQNENINIQIDKLTKEKEERENDLKEKIKTIRTKTIKDIINNVDKEFKVTKQIEIALKNNETFINSTDQLKKVVPEQYWINPEELYKQLKSKYTFIKTFFYGENFYKNLLWLIAFLIIIIYTPIFTYIASLLLSWQDFTLTPQIWTYITIAGTILLRVINTYKKLKTLIAPFWKIKVNYENEKKNALFKFNQEEKALKLEIENGKNEINLVNEQINKASIVKASIEFKLENTLSTEALCSFIEKRANSDDYKKHLGIISIIRKDFEVLSDLLTDHKKETEKNKQSEEFKIMFDKPLERIILYIDDLDRCPENRVVEVLEAVNLLMAFPLFVVIVGVDPRWVKSALQEKYKNQFNINIEDENQISPSNYLEKIFQVPFHLKDANDNDIKNMIQKLAQTKNNLGLGTRNIKNNENKIADTTVVDEIQLIENDEQKNTSSLSIPIDLKDESIINEEQIQSLDITDREIEQIKSLTQIIGNNPRCIKRFINIYRIVKTHEDFNYNKEIEEKELLTIMFLLALPMGKFKNLIESFELFLSDQTTPLEQLSNYTDRKPLFNEIISNEEKKTKNILNTILKKIEGELLNQTVDVLRNHYKFIKRFTFKNI